METAYFAGGCFWCITPIFRDHPGVTQVISGYCGGTEEHPAYEAVKLQKTGHRETLRIDFDPQQVSFAALMALFLDSVDPFDGGGQYIDRGHSYTLAVYWCSETQRQIAADAVAALQVQSGKPVMVAVEPFSAFYDAEDYHQDYDKKNPAAFREELIASGRLVLL